MWTNAGFNEHQIMSYLHHLQHPNILPLLTFYTYNGVSNFLLPLAEGGDLEQLLNGKCRPNKFAEDARFYNALSGLTSALETLHEYKSGVLGTEMIGYHHDLKPTNVLVLEARFVLSDFGLSKLKTGEDSRTPFRMGQGHYLAPECEDSEQNFSKGVISRASDVWSLGCIMLEIIVFMVGGTDAVVEFRERRTTKRDFLTTKTFFFGKSINLEVETRIDRLENCEDMVHRKVAALIRQILVIDFRKRPKASEIAVRLRMITFEAAYLRLHAAFNGIGWRIDSLDTTTEWTRLRHMAHSLVLDDGTIAFDAPDTNDLEPFADREHVEKVLASMEKLLNQITNSELSSNVSLEITSNLRQTNDLLSVLLSDQQKIQEPDCEATHLEISSSQNTRRPISPEDVRQLAFEACILTTTTSAVQNAVMSKDEKFLAVEHHWDITIYALPLGEKVQDIKPPPGVEIMRSRLDKEHPDFSFSPDGKRLVVCWDFYACCYRVGRNERHFWTIFKYPWTIKVAAISPDSTKVAFAACKRRHLLSDLFDQIVYIVKMAENEGALVGPLMALVGRCDSIFEFSPDGRQLAVSSQRTVRHNGRTAIRIRLLDVVQTPTGQLPFSWCTIYCNETFNENAISIGLDLSAHPVAAYPRLAFAIWDGRWVAGLWEKSKQALVLHDLHNQSQMASLNLSTLDASGSDSKKVKFSGNLEFAASYKRPTSAILERFRWGKKKTSHNLVLFVSVKTNQAVCSLEGVNFDHCWFSDLGQYIMVRKKKELRVFRLSEV